MSLFDNFSLLFQQGDIKCKQVAMLNILKPTFVILFRCGNEGLPPWVKNDLAGDDGPDGDTVWCLSGRVGQNL